MSWLTIYLISCTSSLIWIALTVREDILCHLGKAKPDHKFGLNYPSWNPATWGFNPYIIAAGFMPGLNIIAWYILIGMLVDHIKEKMRS